MDENQKRYKKAAKYIDPYISENLKDNFNKHLKDPLLNKYFLNECQTFTEDNNIDITDIIAYSLYVALLKGTPVDAYAAVKKEKRQIKQNWIRKIKEEIDGTPSPRNPKNLQIYADSVFQVNVVKDPSYSKTTSDIMLEIYDQILEWKSDSKALISDYFFFSYKPEKAKFSAFQADFMEESLKILIDRFDGSIDGMSVRFPISMTQHPIFSFAAAEANFAVDMLNNEFSFFSVYKSESDEVDETITTRYQPISDSDDNLKLLEAQKEITSGIQNKYNINLIKRDLDTKDQEILTHLFSLISFELLNIEQYITVDIRDFVKKIYGSNRPEYQKNLGERLANLRDYSYTITVKDKKDGTLIESSTIGLINYLYINYEEGIFQFRPSDQLISTYQAKAYISVENNAYNSISSSKAKSLLFILQQERLGLHNAEEMKKSFPLRYFRSRLRLPLRTKNSVLIKDLERQLKILKDKQVIVQDYNFTMKNSIIDIVFLPFTEIEIFTYGFNTQDLLQTKS